MRCERPKPFRLTTTPVHHLLCWCAGLTHSAAASDPQTWIPASSPTLSSGVIALLLLVAAVAVRAVGDHVPWLATM
eukprot:1131328-Prymnesium_polylepis.1